jgi:hypothetical protein
VPSVVDIANLALVLVGAEPIVLITEQNNRARACNAAWPFVRQQVLRSHSWNCATTRTQLAPLATAPSWGFATAYTVPADCLHVMEVDTPEDWRVEGGQILTDATGVLNIRYLRDETDPEQFDASLANALAVRLAVDISEKINGNRIKRAQLLEQYRELLNDAMVDDGEEQSPAEFEEDDWITSRY